jgi:hypothetical protein
MKKKSKFIFSKLTKKIEFTFTTSFHGSKKKNHYQLAFKQHYTSAPQIVNTEIGNAVIFVTQQQ